MRAAGMRWKNRHFARTVTAAVTAGGLLALGVATSPLRESRAVNAEPVAAGVRAFAADLAWLQANLEWEQRDAVATDRLVRLTTALDPRPLEFWINGARAFGYDFSEWEIDARGGAAVVSPDEQRGIRERHAAYAVAFLDSAQQAHPAEPRLWIERAQLRLLRTRDIAAAAADFRRAAELPGAPYFAARLHAELLVQLGREREALAWLREVHARLPATDPFALRDEVGRRVRELESRGK